MNIALASAIHPPDTEVCLSPTESAIIRTLLYFEIFSHPLTLDDIIHCLSIPVTDRTYIVSVIEELVQQGYIKKCDGYYLIHGSPEIIERRKNGEKLARKSLKTAKRFSSLIAHFPFVRAICLSGSISKYYMDEKSDIDYFIITTAGRMWVARTLLVLFKKIFLLNSKKYFCVNYFITEESLYVSTQNIYAAMEMSSIVPTYNYPLYKSLLKENNWIKKYYPNFPIRGKEWVIQKRKYFLKPVLEKIFGGKAGERLDKFCYRLTLNHWKKKFSHFDESTFDHRLRNGRNESKHHPLGYQQKVLEKLEQKIRQFEVANGLILSE